MTQETTISNLIVMRLEELRITRTQLVVRCGYRNISKGLRKLDELSRGDISRASALLARLPNALCLDATKIQTAVEATFEDQRREEEEEYRNLFRPHAIIQTDKIRPEPIFVAMLIGISNILRIDFLEGSPPLSYPKQAEMALKRRLVGNGMLPAFGRPRGFAINYSPNSAVLFDLEGLPLRAMDRAVRIGARDLRLRGRPIPKL